MAMIPWIVAALVAITTITLVYLAGRGLIQGAATVMQFESRSVREASVLPWWLRVPAALLARPAGWAGPLVPIGVRETVQEVLKHAGYEELLTPPQFMMVSITFALSAAAVSLALGLPVSLSSIVMMCGGWLPVAWLRAAITRRRDEVIRELPLYVDMLTLALEAGGSLSVALKVATERSPDSVLRRGFLRVQGDLRAGRSRAEALQALGERLDIPAITPLIAALVQADASGGSLAAVLRAQSEQRLNERFARAEKRAMEAPVKMLGPLVLCIFPCTFLILAFPIVMRFFAE